MKTALKFLVLGTIVLAAASLSGCTASNVYSYILDESYEEFLVMGTSADYAPYEWPTEVDGKATLAGIDIEIAKLIADSLGKNLQIVNKGFDFLLDDLESGKVDFVMAGMTPTEARATRVDFSTVYYEAIQVVLIQADDASVYTSLASLNLATVKIGAQLGTIQQDLVEENFADAQQQFIQTVPDLVTRLLDGQLNALVMEKPVADGYLANQSGLAIASITIGEPDGGSAVAVQKGDSELLAAINAVLATIMNDGTVDAIVAAAIALNVAEAE